MKLKADSGSAKVFTNGRNSVVSEGSAAVKYNAAAVARPATDCQKYFQRGTSPRELRTTSFR